MDFLAIKWTSSKMAVAREMSQSYLLGDTVTSIVGMLRPKTYYTIFLCSKYSSCIKLIIAAFHDYIVTPNPPCYIL